MNTTLKDTYHTDSKVTYRELQRLFKIKYKIPRKLKKAARHIIQVEPEPFLQPSPVYDGTTVHMTRYVGWKTTGHYPCTKWVRKAIGKVKAAHERHLRQMMEDSIQRLNDWINTPPTITTTTIPTPSPNDTTTCTFIPKYKYHEP